MNREFEIVESMLGDNIRELRQQSRKWAEDNIVPHVADAYERGEFPREFAEKIGANNWFGIVLPSQYGCMEKTYHEYGVLCQEMERVDSGLRSFYSVQSSLAMHAIYTYGDESQKSRYLPDMACGRTFGCFSLSEPHAGSDPSAMKVSAEKTSAGWKIHGRKRWATSAPLADIGVVWAKTSEGVRGFIVDLKHEGVKVLPIEQKLSLRMSASAEIDFDNYEAPPDSLLPGSEVGLRAPLSCLTQARFGICWGAIGAAMDCYETALRHCHEREQFGKRLSSFQLAQQKLADSYDAIIRGQLLNLRLADLMQAGECSPAMISMGKRGACRVARQVARDCRDLLGGDGILLSNHVMRHMSNLETVYTYEGTDHIHTLILGQYLTGENAFG